MHVSIASSSAACGDMCERGRLNVFPSLPLEPGVAGLRAFTRQHCRDDLWGELWLQQDGEFQVLPGDGGGGRRCLQTVPARPPQQVRGGIALSQLPFCSCHLCVSSWLFYARIYVFLCTRVCVCVCVCVCVRAACGRACLNVRV